MKFRPKVSLNAHQFWRRDNLDYSELISRCPIDNIKPEIRLKPDGKHIVVHSGGVTAIYDGDWIGWFDGCDNIHILDDEQLYDHYELVEDE